MQANQAKGYLKLYHATLGTSVDLLLQHGIAFFDPKPSDFTRGGARHMRGFYLTHDYECALRWARRKAELEGLSQSTLMAIVPYELNMSSVNVRDFGRFIMKIPGLGDKKPDTGFQRFIYSNSKEESYKDYDTFDVFMGPMSDGDPENWHEAKDIRNWVWADNREMTQVAVVTEKGVSALTMLKDEIHNPTVKELDQRLGHNWLTLDEARTLGL